jgi:hypothetical protein
MASLSPVVFKYFLGARNSFLCPTKLHMEPHYKEIKEGLFQLHFLFLKEALKSPSIQHWHSRGHGPKPQFMLILSYFQIPLLPILK